MIDNPFAEPEDDDRTLIRPVPGGRRPPAPAAPAGEATEVAPAPRAGTRPLPRRAIPVAAAPASVPDGFASPLLEAAAPLLHLLARLRNTLTPPQAGDLRERTVRAMRAFEQRAQAVGIAPDFLRPAHYALCASLDDVVLNTPWGSAGDWDQRSLVSTFHHEVHSGERFFDLLAAMRQNPGKFLSVLELMYLCLSLGFMGRYRLSPRGPAEIDGVREDIYAAITSLRPRADSELSPQWRGVAAAYRPARARLPFWVAGAAGLAVIGGLFAWNSVSLNAASDTLTEQMRILPPATMPAITRAGPVVAVTSAPSAPGALERLRGFLKPEIDAGLVAVLGTEDTPIIRVRQGGTFPSGSAALLAKGTAILARIGEALKTEPGPVEVNGYTDDQPIRTVRFPSNFQLSAARAEAARAVLARTIGDASRLSAEGRADADPIAPNSTEQGRDANRRIEIILHRQG